MVHKGLVRTVKSSRFQKNLLVVRYLRLLECQQRAIEAKERVFSALDDLKSRGAIPLYCGKPSITKLKEATGIDRGTISKYINEWLEM